MPTPATTLLALAQVVIVVIGDSAWEDGYRREKAMPEFRALQERGTTFARFIACPIGSQSVYELYFGEYPIRNGSTGGFNWYTDETGPSGEAAPDVPHDKPSLPEAFQRAGYATALFGKWGLGGNHLEPVTRENLGRTPALHGFERWSAGIASNVVSMQGVPNRGRHFEAWERWEDGVFTGIERRWADLVIAERFLEWWAGDEPRPRFAVVWFEAGHGPWDRVPPAEALPRDFEPRATKKHARYRAMLRAVDHQLGRLAAALDFETTWLVVFSAAGTPDVEGIVRTDDVERVKRSVFERGIHTPALILGPGIEAGAEDERLVAPKDLWARLAALPGIALEGPTGPDGRLTSEVLYRHIGDQRAARSAHLKLVEHGDGKRELYDLRTDPEEQAPITGAALEAFGDPAALARLVAVLENP